MTNSEKTSGSIRGPIKPVAKPISKPTAKPVSSSTRPPIKPVGVVKPAAPVKPASPVKAAAPVKPAAIKPITKPEVENNGEDKKSTIISSAAKKIDDKDPLVKAEKKAGNSGGDGSDNEKGSSKLTSIFLPILIALLVVGVIVQYSIHSTMTENLEKEINLQIGKYDDLYIKYTDLLNKNESLTGKLSGIQTDNNGLNTQILDLIDKLKKNKLKIGRYVTEINALKNNPAVSQEVIDSFEREHARQLNMIQQLSKSNEIKALEISTLKEQISEIENPTYEELSASDVDIVGLYEKKGEDIISNKGKKVEYLEIMFYIDENEEVKPGMKTFFFALTNKDGDVIDDNGTITLNKSNQTIAYTFSGHVDYPFSGVETKTWIRPDNVSLKKGSYTLTIYNNDVEVGKKKIEFK